MKKAAVAVTVFNVGQAAATLIDFGDGNVGIVDCGMARYGGNPLHAALIGHIAKWPSARIIFLLLSHLDLDHFDGVGDLAGTPDIWSRVERLFCNGTDFRTLLEVVKVVARPGSGVTENTRSLRRLEALVTINKVLHHARRRDFHAELVAPSGTEVERFPVEITVGGLRGVKLLLLGPSQQLKDDVSRKFLGAVTERTSMRRMLTSDMLKKFDDWNSASVVLVLEVAGRKMLFPADANRTAWESILARAGVESVLPCDVAVAWHHGARLGRKGGGQYDSLVWARVMRSDMSPLVVISHGCANNYGHPHAETVSALDELGAQVICTECFAEAEGEDLPTDADFPNAGMALSLPPGETKLRWARPRLCGGDVTVRISEDGEVSCETSGRRTASEAPFAGCCLREYLKYTG